ncbi:MAG: 16S rRNA (cytidine1402-2'-O)-methyltransferase [Cyclobacteriaceae bacterium]|jgi:16S rRNA (cytidine1402-2'-O)-methyltransferase
MNTKKGSLYLIPNNLSDQPNNALIAPIIKEVIQTLKYYLVENVRTSRRFISSLSLGIDISTLQFEVLNKSSKGRDLTKLFKPIEAGYDLGIQSEAGLPGIADPGHFAVAYAHQHGIRVIPLPGSSSIILGLISSGFNGQSFTFHGYIPIDGKDRDMKLSSMEAELRKTGYTQIFMETPFRNNQLVKAAINRLSDPTLLLLASDITGSNEKIQCQTIGQWKENPPDLHKIPCIFAIGDSVL